MHLPCSGCNCVFQHCNNCITNICSRGALRGNIPSDLWVQCVLLLGATKQNEISFLSLCQKVDCYKDVLLTCCSDSIFLHGLKDHCIGVARNANLPKKNC